uniref:Uncharacterized protein n=1 Tax=Meloidogyne incognita TaxID=6306 RepID=A0A914KLC0_MELIC
MGELNNSEKIWSLWIIPNKFFRTHNGRILCIRICEARISKTMLDQTIFSEKATEKEKMVQFGKCRFLKN